MTSPTPSKPHIYIPVQNSVGDVLDNIIVRFLQPDTETLITDTVYASPTDTNSVLGQPFSVPDGIVDVYIENPQRLRVGVTVPGQAEFFIEDVDVSPAGNNMALLPALLTVTNQPTQAGMVLTGVNSTTAEWAALPQDPGGVVTSETTSGAYTVTFTDGAVTELTVTGSTTLSLATPGGTTAVLGYLVLTQDATGGHTITMPTGVKWPAGTVPTLPTTANSTSIVMFLYTGTTWFAAVFGSSMA